MSKTADVRDLIDRRRISMKTVRIASNPVMGATAETGAAHYKCRLQAPDGHMDAYLSLDPEDGRPKLPDVMVMLAMDASGCGMLEGFGEFRNEWSVVFGSSDGNLKELEDFWREYQGRCSQSRAFREFLGERTYLELMERFDPGAGGMEFLAAANM